MALSGDWNYTDSTGVSHSVELLKNRVTVDGGEPVKINKLRGKGSNMLETVYEIPNGTGDDVKLYFRNKNITLVCNGINVQTGETYEPVNIPGWIWVFYILFIVDFFLIIGGAVGGCIFAGGAALCSTVASSRKMKGAGKVFACIGIYAGFTIVSLIIAVLISGLIS